MRFATLVILYAFKRPSWPTRGLRPRAGTPSPSQRASTRSQRRMPRKAAGCSVSCSVPSGGARSCARHCSIEPALRRAKLEAARPITIGDNVWIGGGAIVLPGVTVGENSVIGAGAVVTRDVPANGQHGGRRQPRSCPADDLTSTSSHEADQSEERQDRGGEGRFRCGRRASRRLMASGHNGSTSSFARSSNLAPSCRSTMTRSRPSSVSITGDGGFSPSSRRGWRRRACTERSPTKLHVPFRSGTSSIQKYARST
jgi:Hexapeptide repeat of succinyl-transferase